MRRRFSHSGVAAIAIASTATGASADERRSIQIPSQPLTTSVQAIARRFGIELLFSEAMLAGRMAPAVSGRFNVEQALGFVLAGSGLTFRRTADGTYVLTEVAVESSASEAVPEILVIGRRTQNADIRRSESDFRPYHVITRAQVATSHAATVEELVAKQLPANSQGATLSQQGATAYGETASSIDLQGLGPAKTLVLIDGRRLPQLSGLAAGFIQPDINAVSPEAIDRVEAITATAGGIYGPGATAGVVNLVLRRDYRGVDLAVTQGVASRGDALYRRYDFRAGFTPDQGRTEIMLAASQSTFDGLDVGDRDFAARAATRAYANDAPTALSFRGVPISPSVNIASSDGNPLTFKPTYGGAPLNASYTHVAPADGLAQDALVAQLASNAGSLDLRSVKDPGGLGPTLLSARKTRSIIASVRRDIGPVEIFFDYLLLQNEGQARAPSAGTISLSASNPLNPFVQQITLSAPDPARMFHFKLRDSIERATGGVIVNLPGRWRGEADFSFGRAQRKWDLVGSLLKPAASSVFYPQLTGGIDPRNPLGQYSAYLAALEGTDLSYARKAQRTNRFDDVSVRIAGPVIRLDGGELTATLSAEQRRERVPQAQIDTFIQDNSGATMSSLSSFAEETRSVYGELRAPVLAPRSGSSPALELQFALRRDRVRTRSPSNLQFFDAEGTPALMDGGEMRRLRDASTVLVAGFKAAPTDGLLLRGSVSTGQQPLTVVQLFRYVFAGAGYSEVPDPKRGGELPSGFDVIDGGPLEPKPERARSLSVGFVVQPAALSGARFSLDYTHIVQRGESVSSSVFTADFLIANEALFPGRITRAPLTPDDAARGYTEGSITAVDATGLQTGSTTIDAFDGRLDLSLPTEGDSKLGFHMAVTWQPRFRRSLGKALPTYSYRNKLDGALEIRGNAGLQWSRGPLELSLNGQLFGSYSLRRGDPDFEFFSDSDILLQGSSRVPAQVTFDAAFGYRAQLADIDVSERAPALEVRFGMQNMFDTRPATVVNAPGDYNVYADARRRRFDLTIAISF